MVILDCAIFGGNREKIARVSHQSCLAESYISASKKTSSQSSMLWSRIDFFFLAVISFRDDMKTVSLGIIVESEMLKKIL